MTITMSSSTEKVTRRHFTCSITDNILEKKATNFIEMEIDSMFWLIIFGVWSDNLMNGTIYCMKSQCNEIIIMGNNLSNKMGFAKINNFVIYNISRIDCSVENSFYLQGRLGLPLRNARECPFVLAMNLFLYLHSLRN